MSSQFNNYLPRTKPISKYGEEAYWESHRFGKHKEKNGVKTKKQQPVFPSNSEYYTHSIHCISACLHFGNILEVKDILKIVGYRSEKI